MRNPVTFERIIAYSSLLSLSFALAACGSDESEEKGEIGATCTLERSECDSGLSCDPLVSGEAYVCAAPVTLKGVVSDALTGDPLGSSRVVVLGAEGAPVGDVVFTDEDGAYSVAVSAPRNADGSPAEDAKWTLTVSAQGYQVFPAGPRPAIPISATQATDGEEEGSRLIDAANTQVALLPLGDAAGFGRQISGSISADAPGGTLVVAEGATVPAPYAIASRSGEFTIYNVPDGSFELVGYKRGQQLTPTTVDVSDDSAEGVVIESSEVTLGGVSGNVNIVNAPGGSLTSVVLVPESVFDTRLERGPIPLGLRAPGAPSAPSIDGAFDFDDVPLGDYVVLAAFENDALVRDPDASIGGTSLQTVNVTSGESVLMSESFKITEHLAIVGPGADAPEAIVAPVTFSWADDSSEDRYELELYTALGDLVWEDRAVAGVSGSSTVELGYSGPPLVPGMVYQFRVTSFRDGRNDATAISRSEDLRGVFEFQQ